MTNENKAKKFWWIKITDHFLTSEKVDYLISQDGGNGFAYVVLYQCICLKCANTGGRLESKVGDIIVPLDISKLKRDLKWFTTEQIQRAFELFDKIGLVYACQDGMIAISNFEEMLGSTTLGALEMRKIREKKKKKQLTIHKE